MFRPLDPRSVTAAHTSLVLMALTGLCWSVTEQNIPNLGLSAALSLERKITEVRCLVDFKQHCTGFYSLIRKVLRTGEERELFSGGRA